MAGATRTTMAPEGLWNPDNPGPWAVHLAPEGFPASIDTKRRVIVTPAPSTIKSVTAARMHMLGRARFSPKEITASTRARVFANLLEEARVAALLAERGIDTSSRLDKGNNEAFGMMARHRSPTPRLAAMKHLMLAPLVHPRDARAIPADVVQAWNSAGRDNTNFPTEKALAEEAYRAVSADPTGETRDLWAKRLADACRDDDMNDQARTTAGTFVRTVIGKGQAQNFPDMGDPTSGAPPNGNVSGHDVMEIHHHITRAKPGKRIATPKGSKDVGVVPLRWERMLFDKALFEKKRPGGSVMIDNSGSMAWNLDKLRELIDLLPRLEIAMYSGFHNPSRRSTIGRVCIIARDGRWSHIETNREHGYTGGNDIDVEALQLLATMPEPRIWLSDGEVTGGIHGGKLSSRVDAEMARNKIVRVKYMDDCIALLTRKKASYVWFTHKAGQPFKQNWRLPR